MATVNYEAGKVLQGKYAGYFIYVWEENKSLSIHSNRPKNGFLLNTWETTKVCTISSKSIKSTQDMGSTVQNANPEAVLKAGFWFGAAAAVVASNLGTQSTHTVAVEFLDGEKSLLQLNSRAYTTFKSIEFAVSSK